MDPERSLDVFRKQSLNLTRNIRTDTINYQCFYQRVCEYDKSAEPTVESRKNSLHTKGSCSLYIFFLIYFVSQNHCSQHCNCDKRELLNPRSRRCRRRCDYSLICINISSVAVAAKKSHGRTNLFPLLFLFLLLHLLLLARFWNDTWRCSRLCSDLHKLVGNRPALPLKRCSLIRSHRKPHILHCNG